MAWLDPEGGEMTQQEWDTGYARSLGLQMFGSSCIDYPRERRPQGDDDFILLFNSGDGEVPFNLPLEPGEAWWETLVDTSLPDARGHNVYKPGDEYPLRARSLALLRSVRGSVQGV